MKRLFVVILLFLITVPVCASPLPNTERLPVLLYHHLMPLELYDNNNAFVVSVESFAKQLAYLHENGYRTVTLDELHGFLYEKKPLPYKSVMITFDDGYYSNILYAYPILKEYGFTAVIFLITEHAEEQQFPNLFPCGMITKNQMEDTLDVFEYATHTHAMHKMTNGQSILSTASYDEIIIDIQTSLEIVKNQTALAYPHGQSNDAVIEAIKEAGIEMAFAITRGYVSMNSNPFRLNRFVVYRATPMEQVITYLENAL